MRSHVPPTHVTRVAFALMLFIVAATGTFLVTQYELLPWVLPVRFKANGIPIGWQYRTPMRVMMPVLVQVALMLTFCGVGALLLSRPHKKHDGHAADMRAASIAAESVTLIALIWVGFQGFAAFALARMWTAGRDGLGWSYTYAELTCLILTGVVAARARAYLGRPEPRTYVAEHWLFGHLYRNPEDPALFVPTRDGARWTLNFGRPLAAALLGFLLVIGIVVPPVILGLALRA